MGQVSERVRRFLNPGAPTGNRFGAPGGGEAARLLNHEPRERGPDVAEGQPRSRLGATPAQARRSSVASWSSDTRSSQTWGPAPIAGDRLYGAGRLEVALILRIQPHRGPAPLAHRAEDLLTDEIGRLAVVVALGGFGEG